MGKHPVGIVKYEPQQSIVLSVKCILMLSLPRCNYTDEHTDKLYMIKSQKLTMLSSILLGKSV